ncbi:MAG: translation initiation factor IF-2 [Ignavibacteria bacterium]|nr:translation initiation factor IF-2 [Ignavibacteria bacterium]
MAETAEKKKKIYKLATELNLSHETLIQFLRKKGYQVRSHMTSVDGDMLREILAHFKKDKDVAEKHQRKIQEIRESRKRAERKLEEHIEPATTVQVAQEEAITAKPAAEQAPAFTEETPPHFTEPPTAEPPPIVEAEEQVEEKAKTAKRKKKEPAEEPVLPAEEEPKVKVGLTIKGKIDLAPKETVVTEELPPGAAEVEEPHKKKKKKRKIREETTEAKIGEVDELEGRKKKKKKLRHKKIDQAEVKDAIRRTFAAMDDTPVSGRAAFRKRKRREREEEELRLQEEAQKEEGKLRVTEYLSVNDLANLMRVNVADVIKKCMELGIMVSINQRLDKDTITLVGDEFGYEISFYVETAEEEAALEEEEDSPEELVRRPSVVTIMGHVDHGKTSLLDYIRRSNVVAGESGGITQHIGAYEVTTHSGNKISFLDTPGHEAFTAMRARGAQITDIVVLVVAADDNVMPQTLEAISHAQSAGVPIIIAMNKIDKPDANADRIRQQLSEKNILVEEWGGKYQSVELSARTGHQVDLLLEKIALEAEVLDLKANPNRTARGTIVEAQLDKGKGIAATVLVQNGTLRVGDPFLAGIYSGRVRAMFDERGGRIEAAGPSTPVQLTGLDGFPQAGDTFMVTKSDREAREVSLKRQQLKREQDFRQIRLTTLDDISNQIKEGQVKELCVIVKGDVDGSVEALSDSLMKIAHSEVKLRVIHSGVGTISESDIILAAASGAVIIGFRVRPNLNARRLAEKEKVDIRTYNIIYDAINDIHDALEGLLTPEKREEITGTVEVREIFKVPKVGNIAGCYVQEGKVTRSNKIRLVRDGIQVYEGTVSTLKRFKDDVREVEAGFECGLGLENFNDIKVGDSIEAFKVVEARRKL